MSIEVPTRFRLSDEVSERDWGDVDKSRIWRLLKQGLQEGAEGAAAAVREVYAVVKAEVNADLTQADCWGPHHEVRDDGTVVLNRRGLFAAAAALAGARAEPDLTPEQKAKARAHLRRHYRQLELEPPEALAEQAPALYGAVGRIRGEISAAEQLDQLPLSQEARESARKLMAGDNDPCLVAVEIEEGEGNAGYYTAEAIAALVREVNTRLPMGYLGHQRTEDLPYEFPDPVTHWLGAELVSRGGKAVARIYGLIDPGAPELKRWVRADRIRNVSIFGTPIYESASSNRVVDYELLSIDWTPRDRAGMTTRVVWASEMAGNTERRDDGVTVQEAIGHLKEALAKKQTTVAHVVGELGLKFEDVAREIGGELWANAQKAQEETKRLTALVGEIRKALGIDEQADVVVAARAAREAQEAKRRDDHERLVSKVIGEMVKPEKAHGLVRKLLRVEVGADEPTIRKAVGEILEDPAVKPLLAELRVEVVPQPVDASRKVGEGLLTVEYVPL